MLKNLRHLPFYPKKYISHLFILIAVGISIVGFIFPIFVYLFGLHHISLKLATLPFLVGQIVLFQFFHGGWIHLFLNSYFLYFAGPDMEQRMKRKEYLLFFLFSTLFIALSLWIFSPNSITIGISGFCMAIQTYIYFDIYRGRYDPRAQHVLMMIVINILLGLDSTISFVGHLSGAIFGYLWWYKKNRR